MGSTVPGSTRVDVDWLDVGFEPVDGRFNVDATCWVFVRLGSARHLRDRLGQQALNLLLNGFEQELTGWLGSSTRFVSVKDGAFPVFGFPLEAVLSGGTELHDFADVVALLDGLSVSPIEISDRDGRAQSLVLGFGVQILRCPRAPAALHALRFATLWARRHGDEGGLLGTSPLTAAQDLEALSELAALLRPVRLGECPVALRWRDVIRVEDPFARLCQVIGAILAPHDFKEVSLSHVQALADRVGAGPSLSRSILREAGSRLDFDPVIALVVPVSGRAACLDPCWMALFSSMKDAPDKASRILLELGGGEPPQNWAALINFVSEARSAGFRIAYGDLGFCGGTIRTMHALRPDIIRIPPFLVQVASTNVDQRKSLAALIEFARCSNTAEVVVDGVDSHACLIAARACGAVWISGDFARVPRLSDRSEARAAVGEYAQTGSADFDSRMPLRIAPVASEQSGQVNAIAISRMAWPGEDPVRDLLYLLIAAAVAVAGQLTVLPIVLNA